MNLYQFKKDEYAFFENILFAFSNGKRIRLQEAKSIFDIYIYFCISQIKRYHTTREQFIQPKHSGLVFNVNLYVLIGPN